MVDENEDLGTNIEVITAETSLREAQTNYYAAIYDVLVAKVGGKYKSLDDWCNHAGCLLSGGRLAKSLVICPCHEVGFSMDTGKNMTSPGVCGDQDAFKVRVENGQLILEGFTP